MSSSNFESSTTKICEQLERLAMSSEEKHALIIEKNVLVNDTLSLVRENSFLRNSYLRLYAFMNELGAMQRNAETLMVNKDEYWMKLIAEKGRDFYNETSELKAELQIRNAQISRLQENEKQLSNTITALQRNKEDLVHKLEIKDMEISRLKEDEKLRREADEKLRREADEINRRYNALTNQLREAREMSLSLQKTIDSLNSRHSQESKAWANKKKELEAKHSKERAELIAEKNIIKSKHSEEKASWDKEKKAFDTKIQKMTNMVNQIHKQYKDAKENYLREIAELECIRNFASCEFEGLSDDVLGEKWCISESNIADVYLNTFILLMSRIINLHRHIGTLEGLIDKYRENEETFIGMMNYVKNYFKPKLNTPEEVRMFADIEDDLDRITPKVDIKISDDLFRRSYDGLYNQAVLMYFPHASASRGKPLFRYPYEVAREIWKNVSAEIREKFMCHTQLIRTDRNAITP